MGKVGVFERGLDDGRPAFAQIALQRFDGWYELAFVYAGIDQRGRREWTKTQCGARRWAGSMWRLLDRRSPLALALYATAVASSMSSVVGPSESGQWAASEHVFVEERGAVVRVQVVVTRQFVGVEIRTGRNRPAPALCLL